MPDAAGGHYVSLDRPGSIRNADGKISIWRVPNVLFESRGSFVGERDEVVERLNKIRTFGGALLLVGIGLRFTGLSNFVTVTPGQPGEKVVNLGGSLAGGLLVSPVVAVVVAAAVVPIVSLILILVARSGARGATLRQLLTPMISAIIVVPASVPDSDSIAIVTPH